MYLYFLILNKQGPTSNPSLAKDINQQDPKSSKQPCSKWCVYGSRGLGIAPNETAGMLQQFL